MLDFVSKPFNAIELRAHVTLIEASSGKEALEKMTKGPAMLTGDKTIRFC